MEYKATKDTMCKTITATVLFILFAVSVGLFFFEREGFTIFTRLAMIGFFIMLTALCYLLAPTGYTLAGNEFSINSPSKNTIIKTEDLAEVRSLDASELSGMIRTFGNGGLFGYYGKFYNRKLGHMTLYTTQRRNMILLVTKSGKKIIITPDDFSLLAALKNKVSA